METEVQNNESSNSPSLASTNSKIIMVSFMAAALLIGLFFSVVIETAGAVATGSLGHFLSGDLVRHLVPVFIGIACYFYFQFSKPVVKWADEVTTEIRRVVWPSRKDTVAMTTVVCVMLIISGLTLGLFDLVSGTVVEWVLKQNFFGLFG
jgi:preprotein translocase subunit SecE